MKDMKFHEGRDGILLFLPFMPFMLFMVDIVVP
jgi:hypothetical protein